MSLKISDEIKPNASLKSLRFRQERESDWGELERLVNTYERSGVKGLSNDEMLKAPVLYRSTLSSLSVARSTSLDRAVIDYLESLCARGYFFIYGSRATVFEKLTTFFRTDWHQAVRELWRETAISGGLLVVGIVIALALYAQSTEWYFAFVPAELAGGRDPSATVESLRETLYGNMGADKEDLSVFASFLFTHNTSVAILAFALGFAFGIPSAALMVMNGATMGMFIALFASHGLGFELGCWLMIHGVTELFAISLAGAAGLNLGRAMAFPGGRSRLDALAKAGLTSGIVMAGVIVMLMVAGVLEGFGRQLITSDGARYSIAGISALIWGLYFYAPRARTIATP
jgi:uncharacterized membrane protein SpoIIM required for sporulation